MLRLVLPLCREFGESKILLTCDKGNVASQKTIIKNGGVLENEIADTAGLGKSGMIQRYWISIPGSDYSGRGLQLIDNERWI